MRLLLSLSVFGMFLGMNSCANGQQLQEDPPTSVQEAYYTTWTGGVKGAGSGYNLFIPIDKDADIEMDTVYFRGRKGVLEKVTSEDGLYVARFKNPSSEHRDIVMHSDPQKEYGNEPPVLIEKLPFELAEGEAVVRYIENGKEKYFRISNIQKRQTGEVKLKNLENIRH